MNIQLKKSIYLVLWLYFITNIVTQVLYYYFPSAYHTNGIFLGWAVFSIIPSFFMIYSLVNKKYKGLGVIASLCFYITLFVYMLRDRVLGIIGLEGTSYGAGSLKHFGTDFNISVLFVLLAYLMFIYFILISKYLFQEHKRQWILDFILAFLLFFYLMTYAFDGYGITDALPIWVWPTILIIIGIYIKSIKPSSGKLYNYIFNIFWLLSIILIFIIGSLSRIHF